MTRDEVMVVGRLVATGLVAGGLKVLVDYEMHPMWGPALVDGGITALTLVAGWLGVTVTGVTYRAMRRPQQGQ